MELMIPANNNLEVPKIIDLKSLDVEVDSYEINDGKITLNLCFNLFVYRNDYDTLEELTQEKKLTMLIDDQIAIDDITIANVKYEVIFNQGIEVIYDLNIHYNEKTEIIKNLIDEEKDKLLEEKLLTREIEDVKETEVDEFIEDETLISLDDSYTTIKILSIKDERDIEQIASRYNISLREIYEQNDFKVSNRIVVQLNE